MSLSTLFSGIADAIRAKDGTTAPIVANDFPARIQAIQTGSKPGTPLDPVQVYQNTRPADWLPMPEPQDNEMYLLVHIPDGASSLLAFTVTCGTPFSARAVSAMYSVSLGTVIDGQFVKQSAKTLRSGDKYEVELFADEYSNLTSDGMKQVMVKVSTPTNFFTWEPSTHSKKTAPSDFCDWNIVEIACKLPSGTKVVCGNTSANKALTKLRYFSWTGENSVTSMGNMFINCKSLTAVPAFDTANVTAMTNMFYDCYSLTAVPAFDTANVIIMTNMFYNCYSLTAVPAFDTANATILGGMFSGCNSLTAVPAFDTANVTNMSYMFYNCNSLTAVPAFDTANVINMASMFYNCYSLASVLLKPAVTAWAGYAIDLEQCSLGHKALVNLFNSLPTITSSKALTITGNPGVSELTDAEKAIATGKNWTLTL